MPKKHQDHLKKTRESVSSRENTKGKLKEAFSAQSHTEKRISGDDAPADAGKACGALHCYKPIAAGSTTCIILLQTYYIIPTKVEVLVDSKVDAEMNKADKQSTASPFFKWARIVAA